jgi:hypothetical protein
MVYKLLHGNPEGEAGKVWLTVEAVGAVERDIVDGENLHGFNEMPHGWS